MIQNFDAYIDSLGRLDDDDLYLDIDETMKRREEEKPKVEMTKAYAPKRSRG